MSEKPQQSEIQLTHLACRYDPAVERFVHVLEVAERTKADPEVIEGLKTALSYVDMRDDYAHQCTSEESAICRQVAKSTVKEQWQELEAQGKTTHYLSPYMLSGRLEGQFLKSMVSVQRARRVLDVGMYTGYSALSMAEALPEGGELVSLDLESYLKERNQAIFDSVPQGKKIIIRIGNAIDIMKEMVKEGKKFDFIFLDAEKSEYIDYVKLCFEEGLLAENGTVAVDNAFRHGNNYLPTDTPPNTARLFGEHVTNDSRLHKVLVPIRDGVLIIRRLSDVEPDMSH